jgi:ribosomal protein S18 acetylase RimI-like enzyme
MARAAPDRRAAVTPNLRAKELTLARWRDFEELFEKYDGVQAGCWCYFYHRSSPSPGPVGSAARREANRRDHRALLARHHAHGILVYDGGRAIGWCQFGRREDLPRIEQGRKYRALGAELGEPPRWRITCFFVDRPYRRSGVAQIALRGALAAIRRRGGGIVEAYPATHGRAVAIWFGTERMFAREGFQRVQPFGASNVLVRRRIAGSSSATGEGCRSPSRGRGTRTRST